MRREDFVKKNMTKNELEAFYSKLEKDSPGKYELRAGLNKEMIGTLSNKTKLVIVGTAIPSGLSFFYMGQNNNIYKWIDDAIGTRLGELKKRGDVGAIKSNLEALGIVFLDVADLCCNEIGNSEDNLIKGYVADSDSFLFLKRIKETNPNLRIIGVSRAAWFALKDLFDIGSEYIQLFYGKKERWLNLFEETLLNVVS